MTTAQASQAETEHSQDSIFASIIEQFDRALSISGEASFSAFGSAFVGIQQCAIAAWATPITTQQWDQLTGRVQAAQPVLTAQFGRPMSERLAMMFGGVHFLITFWKDRKPGQKVIIQGSVLQASALAKGLEHLLEYTRMWAVVSQVSDDIAGARKKMFDGMLDVSGVDANNDGAS